MAKVYLDSGDTFALSGAASVYGSTGTEKVVVNTGVTGVVVDANVERVDLPGASSAFTFKQAGNQLQVLSGSTVVATIPLQDDANGTQIVFSNGSVDAKLVAGTPLTITLGGATVPSAAAAAVTPTTIDATVTSGSGSSTGGTTTGQSFTLTASTDNKVLTTGNDTVDGSTVNTLNDGDLIVDSSITDSDVLNALVLGTVGGTTAPIITNIENVNLDFGGSTGTFNAAGVSGATLNLKNGSSITVSGLSTADKNVVIAPTTTNITTLAVKANAAGTIDDAATVLISGFTGTSPTLTIDNDDTNAIDVLTLKSTGAAANIIALADDPSLIGSAAKKLVVTGDKDLTIQISQATDKQGFDTLTLQNSGTAKVYAQMTGTLENGAIDLSKVGATQLNVASSATISANTQFVLADKATLQVAKDGTGQDVDVAAAVGTTNTVTLVAAASQSTGFKTTGFTTVNLSATKAVTITGSNMAAAAVKVTGSNDITFAGVTKATSINASTATAAISVELNTGGVGDVTGGSGNDRVVVVNDVDFAFTGGSGSADAIAINTALKTVNLSDNNLTLSGVEVLDLSATADYAITVGSSVASSAAWQVLGAYAGSKSDVVTLASASSTVNYSTLTTNNTSSTTNVAFKITGTSANDIITGTNAIGVVVDDTMTNFAGGKAIGIDVIDGGSGLDVLTGGSGRDLFVLAATTASRDTITDFVAGGVGDRIGITEAMTKVGTTAGNSAVFSEAGSAVTTVANATALGGFNVSATKDVIELGNAALSSNGNLANAIDGSELLKAVATSGTASGITAETGAGADTVVFVAYQNNNAYIYVANDAGGTSGLFEASEISLVGTLQNVAAGALTSGDFLVIA